MLHRDGYDATGCFNMNCPGFIRANGVLVAPGDVIKPISGVHEHVQNVTLKVLKVAFVSFLLFILALFSPLNRIIVDNCVAFLIIMLT